MCQLPVLVVVAFLVTLAGDSAVSGVIAFARLDVVDRPGRFQEDSRHESTPYLGGSGGLRPVYLVALIVSYPLVRTSGRRGIERWFRSGSSSGMLIITFATGSPR